MLSKKHNKPSDTSLEYRAEFRAAFLLPKYWLAWFGIFLLWLLTFTPHRLRNGIAYLLGMINCRTNKKRYRIAKKNLLMCFPDKSADEINCMVKRSFYYRSRIFLDYGFLWFASEEKLQKLYTLKNNGELRGLRTLNKNTILLTCHMLALDHGAQALSFDNSIIGLVKAVKNPLMNWLVVRGRTRFNTRLYERTYGMMGIVSSIKSGDLFFYLPDEDLGDAKSEFLPFFAAQKATLTALGRLAKICEAKVLPCVPIFNDKTGQYEVHFLPSLDNYPTGNKVKDALHMNKVLEKLILMAPEQYIWTFRYFKTRPAGETGIY